MRSVGKLAVLGIMAMSGAFAASAAHAFTMEGQSADQYGVPKFDLEEQAKNFSKGGVDTSTNGGGMQVGPGTLHFGVQQGSTGFGPGFLGPMSRDTRQDFNRVVTPESLK
jgi:hypothetical protein